MNRLELREDNGLHVWVTAAPVDGAANKEVIKYLSATLSNPASQISLISGETSRTKRFRFPVDKDELVRRLTIP